MSSWISISEIYFLSGIRVLDCVTKQRMKGQIRGSKTPLTKSIVRLFSCQPGQSDHKSAKRLFSQTKTSCCSGFASDKQSMLHTAISLASRCDCCPTPFCFLLNLSAALYLSVSRSGPVIPDYKSCREDYSQFGPQETWTADVYSFSVNMQMSSNCPLCQACPKSCVASS